MDANYTKSKLKYCVQQLCRLRSEAKGLEREYEEYQGFFKASDGQMAKERAEDRFYGHMLTTLEIGPYEEGRYSLSHRSLETRMDENREERKRIYEKIRQAKKDWQTTTEEHMKVSLASKSKIREQLSLLTRKIEEAFQEKGLEILRFSKASSRGVNAKVHFCHILKTHRGNVSFEHIYNFHDCELSKEFTVSGHVEGRRERFSSLGEVVSFLCS